jgi:hypothetical protein
VNQIGVFRNDDIRPNREPTQNDPGCLFHVDTNAKDVLIEALQRCLNQQGVLHGRTDFDADLRAETTRRALAFQPHLPTSGKLRADRSLPSPLKRNCPLSRNCLPTEIERRGAFDAIMLVGTPVLQFMIRAAHGIE